MNEAETRAEHIDPALAAAGLCTRTSHFEPLLVQIEILHKNL